MYQLVPQTNLKLTIYTAAVKAIARPVRAVRQLTVNHVTVRHLNYMMEYVIPHVQCTLLPLARGA